MGHNLAMLEKLSQSRLQLFHRAEDVSGRTVMDVNGEVVGTIEDLLVDTARRMVRFLQVGSGGVLGIGREHFLLPIEVVESIRPDAVQVNQTREHIGAGPVYQPDLVLGQAFYQGVYDHYGYPPYWDQTDVGARYSFPSGGDTVVRAEQNPPRRNAERFKT